MTPYVSRAGQLSGFFPVVGPWHKSLIYQLAPLAIGFVDLFGQSQSEINGFSNHLPNIFQCLPILKQFPMKPSQMVVCDKPLGAVRLIAYTAAHI